MPAKTAPTHTKEQAEPTPILIICFDRPEKAALLLSRIKHLPNKLYLFRDGGGSDHFRRLFEETKKMRAEGATKILIEKTNLGGRDGPWRAIRWFFSEVPSGIILEEDIVPAPEMFECYSKALKAFSEDRTVFALGSAPNKNVKAPGKETWTRSPLLLVWGWATWADRIKGCEIPNTIWQEKGRNLLKDFKSLTAKLYLTREMKKLEANPKYCWSYYLQLHALANGLDILIPETKLARNSGVGPSARRSRTNPDGRPLPLSCATMAKKPAGANNRCKVWQKKVEKAKFVGLIHEIRNRLKLREVFRTITGSGRPNGSGRNPNPT